MSIMAYSDVEKASSMPLFESNHSDIFFFNLCSLRITVKMHKQ
jgi:hypothetical protein